MNGIDIESLLKSTLAINAEELIVEAMRELLKDEIKRYVRQKFEENPKLKAEAKAVIKDLMEVKMRETYILMRLGKVTTELGAVMVPEELRDQMERDLARLLDKELSRVMEKM